MAKKITGIQIVSPSTVSVGEKFKIGVKVLTKPYYVGEGCFCNSPAVVGQYNNSPRGIRYMDNVLPEFSNTVDIQADAGDRGPSRLPFAKGKGPYENDKRPIREIEGISFSSAGIKYIRMRDPKTGKTGISNPISVSSCPLKEKLYWGDIHCQTYFSDGLRSAEELYSFARDEAFLDIFAISDHSEWITDRQWDYFGAVANDFNKPGKFVTFIGQEWTSMKWGHRNVYYPGSKGPILRATDPVQGELSNVYKTARKYGALVIPHHPANKVMGVKWKLGHDARVERLTEIYSVWGNSERHKKDGNPYPILTNGGEVKGQHTLDALKMGRKYGITGGGDIHDGRPGDDLHIYQDKPENYKGLYKQGIMGVWAKDLTRKSIFEALWNRRVYATTNSRIFLTFSINGVPMGGEVKAGGGLEVKVTAASEKGISRIDLVCDGKDVYTLMPNRTEVEWCPGVRVKGKFYYVRVTCKDGNMAWSSPIWSD